MGKTEKGTKPLSAFKTLRNFMFFFLFFFVVVVVFLHLTFWLYKGIGMLKLGRMHRQTGEKFVDPTAMLRQMREVSDF